jgi:hypothetical protein
MSDWTRNLLVVTLAGCTSSPTPGDGGGDTDSTVIGDTAEEPLGGPSVEPDLTADEAVAAISAALRFSIPAFPILASTWDDVFENASDTCPPNYLAFGTFDVPLAEGCTTDEGWNFSGVGGAQGDWLKSGDQYFFGWKTDFNITDPEGEVFKGGGQGDASVAYDGAGSITYDLETYGIFEYPQGELWMAEGASLAYFATGTYSDDDDYGTITGGYSYGGGETLYFDAFSWQRSECDGYPVGDIYFRDQSARWYRWRFDAKSCDGCGDVVFDDEVELGQACLDIRPALTGFGQLMLEYITASYVGLEPLPEQQQ